MQLVHSSAGFSIFDEVLSDEQAFAVWAFMQTVELKPISVLDYAWRTEDGTPLSGPNYLLEPPSAVRTQATNTALDPLLFAIFAELPALEPWIGRYDRDWKKLAATPWIYPSGTALSWHTDSGRYHGAFVYYAHPEWNVQWGGALMLGEPWGRPDAEREHAYRFDNRAFSEELMLRGLGHFTLPKPNRLVVIAPNVPHAIQPVTAAAGFHVRATIGGFFLRDDLAAP